MKKKILLINPWIFDFAAYNFWSRPLGLLKVVEFLSSFDCELNFIDATDSFIIKRWGIGKFTTEIVDKPAILRQFPYKYKKYGITYQDFRNKLSALKKPDLIMMTSIMTYWYPGVQKTIEIVREILGSIPIILGGIYPTINNKHALENSGADIVFKGCIGKRLQLILNDLGIKRGHENIELPYYKLNLYESLPYAPLLTSKGCPFSCSYCASSLLYDGYSRVEWEKLIQEIAELNAQGIKDFAFYDDALLYNPEEHIKPLLREILRRGLKIRFHTPNGLHARFIDRELAELMRKVNFKTLRLSLETVNESRLLKTGQKVSRDEVVRAINFLKKQGFTKNEIGVYLMYGLPEQGIEEVRDGVEFLKSLNVRINLTEFSPLRGTKSYIEMVEKGLIDKDIDPLLTNNTVFSYLYSGYNIKDLRKLKNDVKNYNSMAGS